MQGTFRDPAGSLFDVDGRILRLVHSSQSDAFAALLRSDVVGALVRDGSLIATRPVDSGDLPGQLGSLQGTWFEHDRVGFVSQPAEWSAAMLAQAALHTLRVNETLLKHGWVLKDATPANILFEGTRAVLVDVPSIEPLLPGGDLWIARHQFETTFLLPLLANLDAGCPIQWSLADPARGLSHEQLAAMFGPRRWWRAGRIRNVAIPAALGRVQQVSIQEEARVTRSINAPGGNLEKTRYVLTRSMAGLQRAVEKLADRIERRHSNWSGYAASRLHYSEPDLKAKREFVAEVLRRAGAGWVLDIGANTGEFSEMAAGRANVVAVDLDEVSVSAIHSRARAGSKPIQPLVVDLSQPTPATGWRNAERKSFLDRARGRFNLVLMLAVGHHLRVSAGIPLAQIIETGLQLGQGSLLFEYVPVSDPMFRTIARGREAIYTDYTAGNCEAILASSGRIEMKQELPNGRILYWARSSTPA
jgi:SAM-dependent methyltransferase